MSNGLTFELYNIFYEILKIDAKLLENRVYQISLKSLEKWMTGYGKANFHFGPSSTVGQTIICKNNRNQMAFFNLKSS